MYLCLSSYVYFLIFTEFTKITKNETIINPVSQFSFNIKKQAGRMIIEKIIAQQNVGNIPIEKRIGIISLNFPLFNKSFEVPLVSENDSR